MADVTTVRFFVSGRVQGVGFRWSTKREADRLGITGWARNLPDGRVEVLAQGPSEALAALEHALRAGPGLSHVESVETHDIPHDEISYKSFDTK